MNKYILSGATGLVIVALHMYAFSASKPASKPLLATKNEKLVNHALSNGSADPKLLQQSALSASTDTSSALNFQVQMAQITQKMFAGFDQSDLMQINEAISSAFNESLTTSEFDKAVNKMEEAVKSLTYAFGKNIEVDKNLNSKIKTALETGNKEFDNLIRSGKTAGLSGDFYIARVMKAGFTGLKSGFAKAQIVPENTPVSNTESAIAPTAPTAQIFKGAALSAPTVSPMEPIMPGEKTAPVMPVSQVASEAPPSSPMPVAPVAPVAPVTSVKQPMTPPVSSVTPVMPVAPIAPAKQPVMPPVTPVMPVAPVMPVKQPVLPSTSK